MDAIMCVWSCNRLPEACATDWKRKRAYYVPLACRQWRPNHKDKGHKDKGHKDKGHKDKVSKPKLFVGYLFAAS